MSCGWHFRLLACTAILAGTAGAGDPARRPPVLAVPADFKLVVSLFEVRKEPAATADLVVRDGVAYQFLRETPEEVIVIDPSRRRVVLLDVARKVQTSLDSRRLDAELARLHRRLSAAVARQEGSGGRAGQVAGEMTRNLIDPRLKESFDAPAKKLRLTNPSVEIDVAAEEEPDGARLAMIVNCLGAVAKLGALRDPETMPPFTRLDAIRATAVGHGLRPVEISFLYRLAGPPKRLRWAYKVVPGLSSREREAVVRIEGLRKTTPSVPYERYEKPEQE